MRSSANWRKALLLVALLLHACSSVDEHGADFVLFGTIVSIRAFDATDPAFSAAMSSLETRFSALSDDWYPWSDGELQRINAAIAATTPIDVSPELASLIKAAARFEALSGGRFNAGLGHVSELWGFHALPAGATSVPDAAAISAILATGPGANDLGWQDLTLYPGTAATMLDLGGIAKGALLLEARRLLLQQGIENAIVNLGGDLLVIGQVHGRHARIGIRSPHQLAPIAGLQIAPGEAVFTSGNYERYVEIDGTRYPHILDPRSGQPVQHTASVTVVHTDPVLADAAATALLVGGGADFDALVDAFELEFALLIDAGGDTRLTPGMRQRLHWTTTDNSQ